MSDNLDFMAIFGREGSLDLGSGGEDFDTLFAEKEALQPPEEKAPEATTGAVQQEMTPVEVPNPEEKKEDANAPEEEKSETLPQSAAAPEKKPAAPKVSGKPAASPTNPFEAAMRQVEEKITQDLAGELLQKPPVFQFGGVTEEIADPKKTFEQLRKEKEADFPELEDGKRVSWTMEYGKITKTIPKPKDVIIYAAKAEIEKSEGFRDMLKKAKDRDLTCKVRPHIAAQSKGIASYQGIFFFPGGDGKGPQHHQSGPRQGWPCVRDPLPGIRSLHHQSDQHPGAERNSGRLSFQSSPHPL